MKMLTLTRAVPKTLLADYTDTEYTRLFKQLMPIMQPIMRPIITDIFSENFVITLKNYYLSLKISDDLFLSLRPQN